MATPRSFARITPKDDADPGRLIAFYHPGDRRVADIPADELVELDQEQFRTWLLKQDSRWDFKAGKLAVRETAFRPVKPGENVLFRIDRSPELVALLSVLAQGFGVSVEELRNRIAAAADAAPAPARDLKT